jgi:hypothetical protein
MSSPMVSPASRTSTPLPGSPTPRPMSPLSSAASPRSDISGAPLSPLRDRSASPPARVPAMHPELLHPHHHHNSHVMPRPSFMISDILNDSLRPKHNGGERRSLPGSLPSTTPSASLPPPVTAMYRHHPLLHPGALHLEALAAGARAEQRRREEGQDEEEEDLDVELDDEGDEGE